MMVRRFITKPASETGLWKKNIKVGGAKKDKKSEIWGKSGKNGNFWWKIVNQWSWTSLRNSPIFSCLQFHMLYHSTAPITEAEARISLLPNSMVSNLLLSKQFQSRLICQTFIWQLRYKEKFSTIAAKLSQFQRLRKSQLFYTLLIYHSTDASHLSRLSISNRAFEVTVGR